LAELADKDPTADRYRAISEDAPLLGMQINMETPETPAWVSKVVGDSQQYNQLPPKDGTTSYAVNVLKSLRWPGAVTVSQNGKYASIYVGYGLKRGEVCFNPTEPPEVQKDPSDQNEQPEPTPLKAPEEAPEPDTDKIKGADEEEDE